MQGGEGEDENTVTIRAGHGLVSARTSKVSVTGVV